MPPESSSHIEELTPVVDVINPASKEAIGQGLWEEAIAIPREALFQIQQNYADERMRNGITEGIRNMVSDATAPIYQRAPGSIRQFYAIDWGKMGLRVLEVLQEGIPTKIPDGTFFYKNKRGNTQLTKASGTQLTVLPNDVIPAIEYYGLLGKRKKAKDIAEKSGIAASTIHSKLRRIHNVILNDEEIKRLLR